MSLLRVPLQQSPASASGSSPLLQTKLRVSRPGDAAEREADRVADEVMRMREPETESLTPTAPAVQRVCTECEDELQRQPLEEEEEELMPKAEGGAAGHAFDPQTARTAAHAGGRQLPQPERAFFEPRFGFDFGQVRVHTDARAKAGARAVNARAFTLGSDVVFRTGAFEPGTSEGRKLLAHELTHVVQQGAARPLARRRGA